MNHTERFGRTITSVTFALAVLALGLIALWAAAGRATADVTPGAGTGGGEEVAPPGTIYFRDANDTIMVNGQTSLGTNATLEAVVFLPDGASSGYIFDELTVSAENKAFYVGIDYLDGYFYPHGSSLIYSGPLAADAWHHVAFVQDATAGQQRLFLDGNLVASQAGAANISDSTGTGRVGAYQHGTEGIRPPFRGFLDTFRVSDVARYTAAFSPPTGDLPSDANTLLLYNFAAEDFYEEGGFTKIDDHSPADIDGTLGMGFTGATEPELPPEATPTAPPTGTPITTPSPTGTGFVTPTDPPTGTPITTPTPTNTGFVTPTPTGTGFVTPTDPPSGTPNTTPTPTGTGNATPEPSDTPTPTLPSGDSTLIIQKRWLGDTTDGLFDNVGIDVRDGTGKLVEEFNISDMRSVLTNESCELEEHYTQRCSRSIGVSLGGPGLNLTISEATPPGWIATYSRDCPGGVLLLQRFQTKTCLITNVRATEGNPSGSAVLTIEKHWEDDATEGLFDDVAMTVRKGNTEVASFRISDMRGIASDESCDSSEAYTDGCRIHIGVSPGSSSAQFAVSESELEGWIPAFGGDCPNSVATLESLQLKTCIVANVQIEVGDMLGDRVLTIEKHWAGQTDERFATTGLEVRSNGGDLVADFTVGDMLTIGGGLPCDSVADYAQGCTIDVGIDTSDRGSIAYAITEDPRPNDWVPTWSEDCAAGELVLLTRRLTCVITNRSIELGDLGADSVLTIEKHFIGAAADFDSRTGLAVMTTLGTAVAEFSVLDMKSLVTDAPCESATQMDHGCVIDVAISSDEPGGQRALYRVAEASVPPGWIATFSGGCPGGTLEFEPNESKTCVVTNVQVTVGETDGDAVLTIEKHWVDDPGSMDFSSVQIRAEDFGGRGPQFPIGDMTALVTGAPCDSREAYRLGCTAEMGLSVAGGTLTVTEVGTPGWIGTFSGDCLTGEVDLSPGERKTCIITNHKVEEGNLSGTAVLTIEKRWAFSTGNTSFDSTNIVVLRNGTQAGFTIADMRGIGSTGACSGATIYRRGCTVDVGVEISGSGGFEYTVDEQNLPSLWSPTFGGDCSPVRGVVVELHKGEHKTCVITNVLNVPVTTQPEDTDCDDIANANDVIVLLKTMGDVGFELDPGCPIPGELLDETPVGDLNCDKKLDIFDTLELMRILAGFAPTTEGC